MDRSGRYRGGGGFLPDCKCRADAIVVRPAAPDAGPDVSARCRDRDDVEPWLGHEPAFRTRRHDWRSDAPRTNVATLPVATRRQAPDEPAGSDRSARASGLVSRIGIPWCA